MRATEASGPFERPLTPDPDLALLADANAVGEKPVTDRGASDRIAGEFRQRVHGYFLKKRCSPSEADDLTQQTFLRVTEGKGRFGSMPEFRAWLFRIAANVFYDQRQKHHRTTHRQSSLPSEEEGGARFREQVQAMAPRTPSPLEATLANDSFQQLRRCLAALPPQARRSVLHHYYQERTMQQVADLMKLTLGTVKSHLSIARAKLKDCMVAAGAAPPQFGEQN